MINYYQVLGLNSQASPAEIRRAYRVLARRYHPDVNPDKGNEERFKSIAEAYEVLSHADKRRLHDAELALQSGDYYQRANQRNSSGAARATAQERYRRAQAASEKAQREKETQRSKPESTEKRTSSSAPKEKKQKLNRLNRILSALLPQRARKTQLAQESGQFQQSQANSISIVEVSVSTLDAVRGVRKSVEFSAPEGVRKVSVRIPPGSRSGSILRLRDKRSLEELVIITKVAPHPFISLQQRGVVVEVPISITEAISGAELTLPTLTGQAQVKIPPGTQSGAEIRTRGAGIKFEDGSQGDIFYRLLVRVPTCYQAVGIQDKARALDEYLEAPVRQGFPSAELSSLK